MILMCVIPLNRVILRNLVQYEVCFHNTNGRLNLIFDELGFIDASGKNNPLNRL